MKIALLLSGGVDSSVALRLLKKDAKKNDYDITAFYLKIWLEDELSYLGDCPWEEDLKYARKVCKQAKVPLKVVSMQKEYWKEVVNYTIKEVKAGRTPNPDMMCNFRIKFGMFYKKFSKDYDMVATGHYAQTKEKNGESLLLRNPDPVKDQTYFLANLRQRQVKRALFPIGDLKKEEVRKLAKKFKLPNKDRKDSQGICFLGKVKFKDFIEHHLGKKKGDIIDFDTGKKLGEHDGYYYYTLGQRKGFGLGHGPWYVVKKDAKKNIVYLSNKYDKLKQERSEFKVKNFNWITEAPKKKHLKVKIRHGPEFHNCTLDIKTGKVKLRKKDQGIAPGQFAVFYDKDLCLGCGVIK